ncbi:MAG: 2-phosphosulfolactate phosphatase [Bacteroidota bacterium]|nr:2-phosphosulfolactate phosphatase [Bacteroidota bacterium]HHU97337.1 2-phosphosulfolactate phosphatase [Petrimonas sp.]
MEIDICFSPVLYPFYRKENDTVIVVDVFRASATMCTMLANGATAVISVADIEEAKRYKSRGFLVGAERNARQCDFADFGNSPFDYTREKVAGKEVVFTTTNGTQAIDAAKSAKQLFVGTFSNLEALIQKSVEVGERVVILCAGWNNRANVEDTLFGGRFAEKLSEKTTVTLKSDAVKMALELWQSAKENPLEYLKSTEHYYRLIANGVKSDAEYCLKENSASVVPVYDKKTKKIIVSR